MKKTIVNILWVLLLTSCTNSNQDSVNKNSVKTHNKNPHIAESLRPDIDTTILHVDTAKIKGVIYTALYKIDDFFYVINGKGDTIVKKQDLDPNFDFEDFNGDGFKDIRIYYLTNVPGIQDLLLFDSSKETFKLVEKLNSFPEPNPINGTKYYYSYHRSGCADANWDSDLFYLENSQL